MRKFIDIVNEAPISDVSFVGDWDKSSSFSHAQDRKLLTNPKAVTKIKSLFRFPEDIDFNFIMVNHPDGQKNKEVGFVDDEYLALNMPRVEPQIRPLLKRDEINVIFTNNSGAERMPMTAWIAAHRIGHALMRGRGKGKYGGSYYFKEAVEVLTRYVENMFEWYSIPVDNKYSYSRLNSAYDSTVARRVLEMICTFKSAREKKLRTQYEAIYELLAQYILTGTNKFNPLPPVISWKGRNYRLDVDDVENTSRKFGDDLAYELDQYFESALHDAVGKILVM